MGTLTGGTGINTYGLGINSSANTCGYGKNATNEDRSFRSNGATLIDMGGFPTPLIFEPPLPTFGQDINDSNTVCGYYQVDFNTFRAFRKSSAGSYVDLGLLPGSDPGDDSSTATAINAEGDIVGDCEIGNANHHAFLYETNRGSTMTDLNDLIPANSGWNLQFATGISDNGLICGSGKHNGLDRGFLLKPMVTISGTVTLQDWLGAPNQVVYLEIRDSNTNAYLEGVFVQLGANGSYSFNTTQVGANKRIFAKTWHWLAKQSAVLSLTGNVSNVNFSLKNGDVDTDNEVGIGDYAILSQAFNSAPGDGNWNVSADLNGDQGVDIGDYAILSQNFGQLGDD
jgi:probable HAF family extracellular repeat protein